MRVWLRLDSIAMLIENCVGPDFRSGHVAVTPAAGRRVRLLR